MFYFSKNVIFSLMYTKFKYKAGLYDFGGQSFFLNVQLAWERATEKSGGGTHVFMRMG